MPKFLPFKALYPEKNPEKVSSPPYDVLSLEECRSIIKNNQNSFIRVSRPESEFPDSTNPYSEQIYEEAKKKFAMVKANTPYIKDSDDFYYIYRLKMGEHIQFGIAALASTDDYKENKIKKHEKTRKDKEDDRMRHILKIRSHSGPVLLTYKDNSDINTIVSNFVSENKPFIDFIAENGVQNSVWRIKNHNLTDIFSKIDAFYIADGHHRAASAVRVADEINKNGKIDGNHNRFLAVAFPSKQMKILAYNRLLTNFNGHSEKDLINLIESKFRLISRNSCIPSNNGQIGIITKNLRMTFDVSDYKLRSNMPENNLDVEILQNEVLEVFFGIKDPRTDKRIDFAGGIKGIEFLENSVNSGKAVAAFSMYPVSVDEIMAISDSGGIMPPKSTWFEPKLRDALLLDEF